MKRGKKYREAVANRKEDDIFKPKDAVSLLKKSAYVKFDEAVELHFNLGIDPRHADQMVRGTLVLPHGTGKKVRVVAIVEADKVEETKKTGADAVGAEDLVEKINGGWMDFDVLLATPKMMPKVGKLGRQLGARGLMPSPKSGTVTQDIPEAVKAFQGGRVEYRNDKAGLVHLVIGKVSFTEKQLLENYEKVFEVIQKVKPQKSKGCVQQWDQVLRLSPQNLSGKGYLVMANQQVLNLKKEKVTEIKDRLENSKGVFFGDYRGLTVKEFSELRNTMRSLSSQVEKVLIRSFFLPHLLLSLHLLLVLLFLLLLS